MTPFPPLSLARDAVHGLLHPEISLRWRIPTHLTTRERIALFRLARSAHVVLEIGSYLGASACCFAMAMAGRAGARVVCIDTWHNEGMSEGKADTWASFLANTTRYRGLIQPVRGHSSAVVAQARALASAIDVLFIDGDHSYEGVRDDWSHYRELLRPGATVALHDTGWATGVQRVIAESIRPAVSAEYSLPNMWWGTLR